MSRQFRKYADGFTRLETLSPEEEAVLFSNRDDEKAREEIARRNMRLVLKMANRYRGNGLPIDDLVSEGTIGLMKAIDTFNSELGRFSTHAYRHIRKRIVMALNKSRTVCSRRWERMTDEEKAKAPVMSLNQTVGDGDGELGDIALRDSRTPFSTVMEEDDRRQLVEAIASLTDMERTVIMSHYGIGTERLTLQQIAPRIGVTTERARQLGIEALAKLRAMLR